MDALEERLKTQVEATKTTLLSAMKEQEGERLLNIGQQLKSMVENSQEQQIRSYAEAVRETQSTFLRDQDRERNDRESRKLNIRIVGLQEGEQEDTKTTVGAFFTEALKIDNVDIISAVRVGKNEKGPRHIVVRFLSMESMSAILNNQSFLKGRKETGLLTVSIAPISLLEHRGLSEPVVEANLELWSKTDIVALVETWEHRATSGLCIPGFQQVGAVWNQKRFAKGRGFGGITVYVRDNLGLDSEIEFADTHKRFLCLKLSKNNSQAFIFIVYFSPKGSPVYGSDTDNPMLELAREIRRMCDRGPVWVCGDFNSRTGVNQGSLIDETGEAIWSGNGNGQEDIWSRSSKDLGTNLFSEFFLQLVNICGMTILNGSRQFESTGEFTCTTPMGTAW
ncbi:hypothetical protein R1sor_001255 [Riccia sorocarpa]|uniref:Endonuclease/exonuclease/phosphatase domain-containing protein n=1 Tax=Riccia sorocarpa TaxID=122646 RepID=A0ABD3GVS2_9MARC